MPDSNENWIKLRDFVASALTEIVKGTAQAQEQTSDANAVINPVFRQIHAINQHVSIRDGQESLVEFDVAVTATARSEGKGAVGGLVSVIGAGYQKASASERSEVSRIKFSVRVLLPDGFSSAEDKQ